MTHSNNAEGGVRLGNLCLANVSLSAAFALAYVFSTGSKLLAAFGLTPLIRLLLPYQQHLLLAFANYWLPATLIYVLLRVTRLDSRLRVTATAHWPLLTANVLLLLYVAARVFASTVEGGGASYVLVSMSPLVIVPAWVSLAFGFVALVYRSVQLTGGAPKSTGTRRFSRSDSILVAAALLLPLAFVATLPVGRMVAMSSEYSRLCGSAEVKILEKVPPARGIALIPDSFSSMPPRQRVETRPWMPFLLNQSLLQFVERPASAEGGFAGKAKYERVTTVGQRILRSAPGSKATTQFAYEPADELLADYEVRPTQLEVPRGAELGLGGARIEIRRRADDQLVAYAQYYWNNKEFRACPEESHRGLFIYNFVVGALNVKNPEGPK